MPSEKGGAGANGYTYFVCNQLGGALSRLPPVKPSHIKAARQVKKFVSGKLDAQVSRLLNMMLSSLSCTDEGLKILCLPVFGILGLCGCKELINNWCGLSYQDQATGFSKN